MPNIIIGKYKFIDPDKEMYLGYGYEKDGKRALEKRCDYCGKWMTFDIKNIHLWDDNIKMGFNDVPEKIHCGSAHCIEYHRRVLAHEKAQSEMANEKGIGLFKNLLKKKVIV